MKIQITFKYNEVDYRYTIDEEDVNLDLIPKTWQVDLSSEDNEFAPLKEKRGEGAEFRVIANKLLIDGKEYISCDDLYILVYANYLTELPSDTIKNDDGKNIDIQFA